MSIKLELRGEPPKKAGDTGVVDVILMPNVDVESILFSVNFAGEIVPERPEGFEEAKTIAPYINGLKPSNHFSRKLSDVRKDKAHSFSIKFKIAAQGYGYIMGSVRGPSEGKPVLFSESAILYYFASAEEAYFSLQSILDLDIQKLVNELTRKGYSKEEIEKRVKKLKRSGATVDKRYSQGSAHHPESEGESESYNSVTVNGTVQFTDRSGNTHPVRFATVQIWDEETGPVDDLVAATTTDGNGNYTVTFDDFDGDGTGRDIYVVVRAEGDTVHVEDFGANPDVATGDIWEIDSGAPEANVVDGSVLTINITATNNDASPQNVAFEAYEAVNYLSRYLPVLGEPLPAQLNVRYPRPGTDGSNFSGGLGFMRLAGTDVHDWDNIQHEYGHYIQHMYGTANNPGGQHFFDASMCGFLGKDGGVRIGWAEAWPTFFGTLAQEEMGLVVLGIPGVGDTHYWDTKPNPAENIDYDLEAFNAWSMGEGNETAVQRVLWDMYDNVDDAGDTGVSLTPQYLWDLIKDNTPHTFSAFWDFLQADCTEAEKAAYGSICAQHKISAEVTGPADGTVFAGAGLLVFQWNGNVSCDTGGNARYSVRFYNADCTSLISASPWQAGTSFTPTNAQRDLIFAGPNGTIRWLVSSKDLSAPETGVYYGNSRTIIDNFDGPDRNPVDIILALDLSGSMGLTVPGSDTGLIKIQLLQQAVEIFVRTWAMHAIEGDRIGVVYFSTNTSTMAGIPSILMDIAGVVDDLVDDVAAKTVEGCTAIGGSLQVGYNSFEDNDHKKVIILFSDGEQTTNPFIDEEGAPAKLKIRVIPAGGALPFDAYWCSEATAKSPDGTTIVPDGQFLHEHALEVHSIGVGVTGASFEELIERISDETGALHHFTSAPDEDLDIFYTNDLINSLKTGTLEIIKTDKGTLASGDMKTISLPVNKAAKSLTVVLSWKNELKKDALVAAVAAPDGNAAVPSEVSKGDFFTIYKFTFPPMSKDRELPHWGNWTIKIQSSFEKDFVKYQLSAIVDEPCFDYDFDFPRRDYSTGDPIKFTVTLTQNGKPLPSVDGVWVDVTSPAQPTGNLLSACLPGVKPATYANLKSDLTGELYPNQFDAMVAVLLSDPRMAALVKAKRTTRLLLYDDGKEEHGDSTAKDGIYSNIFSETSVPGNYEFRLHILASSECGKVRRTETTSTLIGIKKFDPAQSSVTVIPINDSIYTLSVSPSDSYGNLLGPGNRRFISIFLEGGSLEGSVVDRYDGSYEQRIVVKPVENPVVTILVRGKQLFRFPLLSLVVKEIKGPEVTLPPQVTKAPLAQVYTLITNLIQGITDRPSEKQKSDFGSLVDYLVQRARANNIEIRTDIKKLFNLWYLYPNQKQYRDQTLKALEEIKKKLKIS